MQTKYFLLGKTWLISLVILAAIFSLLVSTKDAGAKGENFSIVIGGVTLPGDGDCNADTVIGDFWEEFTCSPPSQKYVGDTSINNNQNNSSDIPAVTSTPVPTDEPTTLPTGQNPPATSTPKPETAPGGNNKPDNPGTPRPEKPMETPGVPGKK